jgi:hypothetical protein
MRFAWALALVLAGCVDGEAPPSLIGDEMGVNDDGGDDLSGAVLPDLSEVDLIPQQCRTACDCPSGDACVNNVCAPSTPQVFCCGTFTCLGADTCQNPNGSFSQCTAPQDAAVVMPDAGNSNACANTSCVPGLGSQLFCTLACGTSTATCSGTTMRCQP